MAWLGMVVAILLVGCGRVSSAPLAPTGSATVEPLFDGGQALTLVEEQMAFGDRSPGTPGHEAVQTWIADRLKAAGWATHDQTFEYRGVALTNLVGSAQAGGPPHIILGAHYDTRPLADESPDPDPGPVPGANDGASGVAVLLGLAQVIPPDQTACRLDLAFFDGEDSGRLNGWDWVVGSTYMAQHLSDKPQAVVVVDMVGDRDLQLYFERNSSPDLRQAIWDQAGRLGYRQFIPEPKYSMIDDHTPFLNQGLSAVDVIDFDYAFWHTPQDTLDKISAGSLEAVGRTLQAWLDEHCG